MRIKRRTKLPNPFILATAFFLLTIASISIALLNNWKSMFLAAGLTFIYGSILVFLGIRASVKKIPLKSYQMSFLGGILAILFSFVYCLMILEKFDSQMMLIPAAMLFLYGCYGLFQGWLELNEKFRD